jgi:hypothetical protein
MTFQAKFTHWKDVCVWASKDFNETNSKISQIAKDCIAKVNWDLQIAFQGYPFAEQM